MTIVVIILTMIILMTIGITIFNYYDTTPKILTEIKQANLKTNEYDSTVFDPPEKTVI